MQPSWKLELTSFVTFSTTPFLKACIVSTGVALKIPHTGSAK
jgi:hypothetical protein